MRKITIIIGLLISVGLVSAQNQTFTNHTSKKYFEAKKSVNEKVASYCVSAKPATVEQTKGVLNEGFEGSFPPVGWSIIDIDGDGNNWFQYTVATSSIAHTGTYAAASASWLGGTILTPNNWLISPSLLVTQATDSLTYWVSPQDPLYPGEHYSVFVSTTGKNSVDFLDTLIDITLTAADTTWHKKAFSLSTFVGDTIYVAFVHSNCSDMFYIKLDDVTGPEIYTPAVDAYVLGFSQPTSGCGLTNAEPVTIRVKNNGATSLPNLSVKFKVDTNAATTLNYATTINPGDTISFTSTANLSVAGAHILSAWTELVGDADATNDTANYQVTNVTPSTAPYIMGFETTDDMAGISVLDVNNDGKTWGVNTTASHAHTGTQSAVYTYSTPNAADDWLFTKCLDLTTGVNYQLSFWYEVRDTTYPEKLLAAIGNAQTAAAMTSTVVDLGAISNATYLESATGFTVPTTGTYYVGFKAYSDADMWNLYVDDIAVSASTSINKSNASVGTTIYPNPAKNNINVVSGETIKNISLINAIGQTVFNEDVNAKTTSINTSSLVRGIYFVKVQTNNGTTTKRISIIE